MNWESEFSKVLDVLGENVTVHMDGEEYSVRGVFSSSSSGKEGGVRSVENVFYLLRSSLPDLPGYKSKVERRNGEVWYVVDVCEPVPGILRLAVKNRVRPVP